MPRFDTSRFLFILSVATFTLGFTFVVGLAAGAQRGPAFRLVQHVFQSVALTWNERHVLSGQRPTHHLQPARHDGAGVTVNDHRAESDHSLVLLSGFFERGNELRLITRDGKVLSRWPVPYSEIFAETGHLPKPPQTDWNVTIHGAIALPDGSVVFNFENAGSARLDRCGKVVWALPQATHHSVEQASDGGFWIPGRRHFLSGASPYPPFALPFTEDTILHVSDDGEVLTEISIAQAMKDSGLLSLLTLTGSPQPAAMDGFHDNKVNREIFHLNDIEELTADRANDFANFEAGDLLISLRNRNLILVLDPHTRLIKWWQIGPWVRQHDPDFLPGGKIAVFNNNRDGTVLGEHYGGSEIVVIDLATDEHEIVYGAAPDQKMHTNIRGKHQFLPGDRILITQPEAGRVFEVEATSGDILWKFVNRYGRSEVAELTEARAYPRSYFDAANWKCSEQVARN